MCDHYSVIGPEMYSYYDSFSMDPPEHYWPYGEYTCADRNEAKRLAVHDPAFSQMVGEARSDCRNPYFMLKVRKPTCDHGVCYMCEPECETCVEMWALAEVMEND